LAEKVAKPRKVKRTSYINCAEGLLFLVNGGLFLKPIGVNAFLTD